MDISSAQPIADNPLASATAIMVFLLVTVSVGAMCLAWWLRRPEARRLRNRIHTAIGSGPEGKNSTAPADQRNRMAVQDALREIDAKAKAGAGRNQRPTLTGRMRQAGLSWSRYTYLLVSIFVGLAVYVATLVGFGQGLVPSLGAGVASGLLLPHIFVSRKRNARLNRFALEFPNALDTVVRGVKAGLPLVDCLKIIATEAQEPVSREFAGVVHDQALGVPLDEAIERLAVRIPLTEANFFAIVIAIQSRTGGSLSEVLGNLSKVLRERKNLRAKVKAVSSEAKTSAWIIGAMPLVVAMALYLTAPEYVSVLFTTSTGNLVLIGCAFWMIIGTLIMRKMINFDF